MNKELNQDAVKPRPKHARRWIIWIVVVLVVLGVAYLGISAYAASEVTKIGDHDQYNDTPETFGLDYENVRFPAREDGLQIAAWYIPSAGSNKVMILVHGRDASKQNAISGNFVKFAASLNQAGYAVLMIDMRGHGESEGERYSFGVYERRDVLGAVDWLKEQGFASGSIGVMGLSMGSAATIGVASEEPAIGVLVVESTFSDFYPVIQKLWQEESGLPNFFLPGVFLMNRILYGYSLPDIRPMDEIVKFSPKPVQILHCTVDILLDLAQAEGLAAAVPYAETWYFDDCEHAELYRDFPDEYEKIVIPFLDENFK